MDDQEGIIDHRSDEDDETEHRQDIKSLVGRPIEVLRCAALRC
jgi:hypothetical protein